MHTHTQQIRCFWGYLSH